MFIEMYQNLKKYLYKEVIDIAIKQEISTQKPSNVNRQNLKRIDNKTYSKKSNYNLIKKERR